MSTDEGFTLEEMATAVRAEILRAWAVAVKTTTQRQILAPERVCISARLIGNRPLHDSSERFRLAASVPDRAVAEPVEFQWSFDAPHDIQIVRAQPQNPLVQG